MVLFSFLLVLLLISLHSFKSLQLLLIVCSASEVLSALNDFEGLTDKKPTKIKIYAFESTKSGSNSLEDGKLSEPYEVEYKFDE